MPNRELQVKAAVHDDRLLPSEVQLVVKDIPAVMPS